MGTLLGYQTIIFDMFNLYANPKTEFLEVRIRMVKREQITRESKTLQRENRKPERASPEKRES